MKRKGEVKWEKIMEYGLIIVLIAAFAILIIAHVLQVRVTIDRNTQQRQAVLLAEDLIASRELIIENPVYRKGVFDTNKLDDLNGNCKSLNTKYTDGPIIFGIEIYDVKETSNSWIICKSTNSKQVAYPVSIKYEDRINPGRLVIKYE